MTNVKSSNRSNNRGSGSASGAVRGKPKAAKNQRGILTLSKKVNQLSSKVNSRNHQALFSKSKTQDMAANYIQNEIIVPKATANETAMTQVFNTDSSIQSRSLLKIREINTLWQVTPGSEEDPIDITVTVVAPKTRKVHMETYNPLTGALSLVEGTDYVFQDGLVMINKLRWKIHYYKKTTTVAQDGPDNLRFPIKGNKGYIKMRNLNWKIGPNRTGNFDDIETNEIPVYMRLFILTFNTNSVTDLQNPVFKFQSIIKGLVAQ